MKKIAIIVLILFGISLFVYRFTVSDPVISGKTIFFALWFLTFILFKINGKVSVVAGLILLFASAVLLFLNHQGQALRVISYAYGLLTIGVVLQFFSLLKNRNEK